MCVLTYNSEDVVVSCIEALRSALHAVAHELVVVDNNSKDRSARVIEERYPEVTVIRSLLNTGYARGNNLGAAYLLKQNCKYLAFVNPDVTVRHDTLMRMESVLSTNSHAGCVGGVGVVHGQVRKGCFRTNPDFAQRFWLYSEAQYLPVFRRWMSSMEANHFVATLPAAAPVYAVSGACIMLPAEIFKRIGGFDEQTFLFQEEYILSERLRSIGYSVYGDPESVYDHVHGHSTRARPLWTQWCFIKSEQYLLNRYYGWSLPKRLTLAIIRFLDLGLSAAVGRMRAFSILATP